MTASQIDAGRKCCATCSNWLGPRSLKDYGARVYLSDDPTLVRGKCAEHLNETWEGYQACAYCSRYIKWSALK